MAVVVILLVKAFIIDSYRVSGNSMSPTHMDGDLLLILKMVSGYERGDVIIFEKDNITYIKRIIGLSGEHIQYKDNILFINGEIVKTDYIDFITEDFETKVNQGYFFVLGDSRENSVDSRIIGQVSDKEIIGKVLFSYYTNKKER